MSFRQKKGGLSQRQTALKPEEEEERSILAYVSKYHSGAGIVKKKVLHSSNLMGVD